LNVHRGFFSAIVVLILLIGLPACTHAPASTDGVAATTYVEHYRPSRSDYLRLPRPETEIEASAQLSAAGKSLLGAMGYNVRFVGAVRRDRCDDVCYFYQPVGVDDLYYVITVDAHETTLLKWFTYSPLDDGSG
jgi:hypothetical protein